jgi:hypothetical protein
MATFDPPRREFGTMPTVGKLRMGVATIENSGLPGVHTVEVLQLLEVWLLMVQPVTAVAVV